MERTIRVTGKGMLSLAPDMIRVSMSLEDTYKEYDRTIRESQKKADIIIESLVELGFRKEDIKTTYYDLDTIYENFQEKTGWKRIFVGYRVMRTMAIEFARDNELLGRVVGMLATSKATPEFRLNFFVKDRDANKSKLLQLAVEDARNKATILASAAGVQLGDILDINHSWGELRFESRDYRMPLMENEICCLDEASVDLAIEPEDVDIDDTVTMVWEIR